MESVWSVSKVSTESVGSRRKLVANYVHTADGTQLDSRFGVGSVYWVLDMQWCNLKLILVMFPPSGGDG